MSRYTFQSGNFEVTTGWDRPLGYFFLDISDLREKDEDKARVFDNLNRPNPGMSIKEIDETVQKHVGIPLPEEVKTVLLQDQEVNQGNKRQNFGRFPRDGKA